VSDKWLAKLKRFLQQLKKPLSLRSWFAATVKYLYHNFLKRHALLEPTSRRHLITHLHIPAIG
jgi:hypothetical protein